jgi:FMN phosphatase YigB (HAD superfamily)
MILFDLDGTIANVDGRRQAADEAQANSVRDDRQDWWCAWQDPDNILRLDVPNELVVSVLRDWRERGKHIVIVSARNDKNRDVTERWLNQYGIHYDALYMRKDGDYRPDNVFKQELLDNIREGGEDLIERVYDDRNQVVDMWRANGIDCIQVVPRDKGEF